MNDLEKLAMNTIQEAVGQEDLKVTVDTPLIGDGSVLDSMKLVAVCLALEDIAEDHDFEFDWTSDVAMSSLVACFAPRGRLLPSSANRPARYDYCNRS